MAFAYNKPVLGDNVPKTLIFWVKCGYQNGMINVLRCGGSGGMKEAMSNHPPSLDDCLLEKVSRVPPRKWRVMFFICLLKSESELKIHLMNKILVERNTVLVLLGVWGRSIQ